VGRRAVLTRGGVTVELAMAIPAVVLVLLAILEVVVVARTQLELVAAAREGARVAATVADVSRAVSAVRTALPPVLGSRVRVLVNRPAAAGQPATVRVTVRHRLVSPLLRWLEIDLSGRAVMRVER
jgi:Flp pilus assembly protein TadG